MKGQQLRIRILGQLEFEYGDGVLSDFIIIIPARNEEHALTELLPRIIPSITRSVIVVDNGSTDQTAKVAKSAGAIVIHHKKKGYGSACLAGINYIKSFHEIPRFICFFDGDGQSLIEDINNVARLVKSGKSQYCQGSRLSYPSSKKALTPMARIGNYVFSKLLSTLWHQRISDLGPLRVMTWVMLSKLNMRSSSYGWTIEMSTKVLKAGVIHCEVPVHYKPRITGKSKISGNLFTAIRAALVMSITFLQTMIFWRPPSDF